MEQLKWQPKPDEIIEAKFGREPIKEAEQISRAILEQIKAGIIDIGLHEGASEEQKEKVKEYLDMWREFSNGIFARTSSLNAKSPETIKKVIDGANSILAVEPDRKYNEAALKMKGALESRYHI